MFEKEAEEYGNEYWDCLVDSEDKGMLEEAYRDGAEFGYNKAFVEADKNLKAVVADFNKANEWHYVKDGDLPVREDYYVIACYSATGDFTDRCQWLNNEWWSADGEVKHFINENVYAWKEKSQPPKESE